MTRPRTGAILFLVAVAAIAGLAGCGGDTEDRLSGLTPDEIVRRSTDAAAELVAFRVTATGNVKADIAPDALPKLVTQSLAPGVSLSGEGPVNGNDATFDMDLTLSGLPSVQANVTKVGGELFLGVLGTDYRVDVPPQRVAPIRPASLPAGLLRWASQPREVGREEVDGSPTAHLSATIAARALDDTVAILRDVSPGLVSEAALRRARSQLLAGLAERTIDVWVGTQDLLPRRIAVRLRFDGRVDVLPQLRSVSMDLDLRLSELGVAVPITAPTTTEVLDLDRLGSLAGG